MVEPDFSAILPVSADFLPRRADQSSWMGMYLRAGTATDDVRSSAVRSYDVLAETAASPAVVWRLLLDSRSWPAWSHIDELDVGRSSGLSSDGRDVVGAIRAFRVGKTVITERVSGLEPGRHFAYEGVESPHMADHQAAIDLHETPGGGTRIRWHGTYRARGIERWSSGRRVERVMRTMVTGLANHAAGQIGR
ncbi:SRPBCC family protein [Amycolatopsis sp. NPDC058340]|uniref:SRPBCC family protein n=1 Tax=Amycolatopsis sp. NPDC058340 TaxID=3346453 RepID=UPI0036485633